MVRLRVLRAKSGLMLNTASKWVRWTLPVNPLRKCDLGQTLRHLTHDFDAPVAQAERPDGDGGQIDRRNRPELCHQAGFLPSDLDIGMRWRRMTSMNAAKTLTLRLPLGVYERATRLAVTRGQSLNRLFQDGFQLLDSQERDKRLFDDFTAIAAAQGDESDVDYAFAAQTETLVES